MKQIFWWVAYLGSAISLCIIINSQPILQDDQKLLENLGGPFNNSIFTNTYFTQKLPASKYTIRSPGGDIRPYFLGIDLSDIDVTKPVNKVVKDVITEQFAKEIPDAQYISPITSTMLLMGCYGDRWSSNFTKLMDYKWMKPTMLDQKYNFLFHLMLHALDKAVEEESGIHDRTTCSCLRDFATPFYLKKREKYDIFKTCNDKMGQTHDSCSALQLYEYSHDSDAFHRNNTLHKQIQTYMNSDAPEVKQLKQDQHILEFTKEYCKHYPKCPSEFKDETTPLRTVLTKMQDIVPRMHAYNKLKVPQFDFELGEHGKKEIYDEKAYREKYAVAFRTCLAVGVPHMTNNIVAVTNQVYWIVIGESILVLASAVSYAYSIAPKLWSWEGAEEEDQRSPPRDIMKYLSVVIILLFACVQFVVSCAFLFANHGVPIFKYLETVTETESVNNLQPSQLNIFFGLFIFLWCFLALLSMMILFYSIWVYQKRNYLKQRNYWCLGMPSQKQGYERAEQAQPSFKEEDKIVKIISDLFLAQIAIDLPIIIGLSITAVGIVLQSGAAEYCVIITVLILFTSTGIVAHITNVMRMLHLEAQILATAEMAPGRQQTKEQTAHSQHMKNLVYNRVLIAVIISGLIFICLNLAGLDPAQAHDFVRLASQQQIILGVITFLILVVADLSLEVTGLVYYFESPHRYVVESVQSKCKHTAWFIVVGLLFLNFHARIFLCEREGNQLEDLTLKSHSNCEWYGLKVW